MKGIDGISRSLNVMFDSSESTNNAKIIGKTTNLSYKEAKALVSSKNFVWTAPNKRVDYIERLAKTVATPSEYVSVS